MKTICTALVAAGLLAVSPAAFAAGRENVSLQVPTRGVNFADQAAVDNFRKDVARRIESVCNPQDRIGNDFMPDFRCRREMAANVAPTVSRLAAAATDNARMATNTSIRP